MGKALVRILESLFIAGLLPRLDRVAPKEQNALGYQARVCRLTAAKRIAEEVMQHLTCCERGHCLGLDISSNLLSRFSCLETG